jgi:hypothetical protein
VVGIDIGKNSFHVVGHDERGAIVLRQKWSRGQVLPRFLPTIRPTQFNYPIYILGKWHGNSSSAIDPISQRPCRVLQHARHHILGALGPTRIRMLFALSGTKRFDALVSSHFAQPAFDRSDLREPEALPRAPTIFIGRF